MKIFILDKFKITKFNLPSKAEDSFLIPYKGLDNKSDNFVTVEGLISTQIVLTLEGSMLPVAIE